MTFKGRSFLTLKDFNPAEIQYLLDLSLKVKKDARRGKVHQRFRGQNLAMVFEKLSTRTRCAFETAFGEEGGHCVFLGRQDIHLGKKESVEDTARVLGGMFSAIAFRGYEQSMVEALARWSGIPVINGLTDTYHPTQILADLMTVQEVFGSLKGRKIAFVGDGNNNVATSLLIGSALMGLDCTIVAPAGYQPPASLLGELSPFSTQSGATLKITADREQGVQGCDAIYTDVWVSMGQEEDSTRRLADLRPYAVTPELMAGTGKPQTIFLHCLPAVKDQEVSTAVIEGPASRVWQEAENRKHTIKAVLLAVLGRD